MKTIVLREPRVIDNIRREAGWEGEVSDMLHTRLHRLGVIKGSPHKEDEATLRTLSAPDLPEPEAVAGGEGAMGAAAADDEAGDG